jgi:hypothetical protein
MDGGHEHALQVRHICVVKKPSHLRVVKKEAGVKELREGGQNRLQPHMPRVLDQALLIGRHSGCIPSISGLSGTRSELLLRLLSALDGASSGGFQLWR